MCSQSRAFPRVPAVLYFSRFKAIPICVEREKTYCEVGFSHLLDFFSPPPVLIRLHLAEALITEGDINVYCLIYKTHSGCFKRRQGLVIYSVTLIQFQVSHLKSLSLSREEALPENYLSDLWPLASWSWDHVQRCCRAGGLPRVQLHWREMYSPLDAEVFHDEKLPGLVFI